MKKASDSHGTLKVYRRLVLLHNLQADEPDNKAKDVMEKDVKYMKRLYAMHKEKESRISRSKSRSRSRKHSKKHSRK